MVCEISVIMAQQKQDSLDVTVANIELELKISEKQSRTLVQKINELKKQRYAFATKKLLNLKSIVL